MASIVGSSNAYPSIQTLQLLNKEIPEISINFTTGKYVFSTTVKQQSIKFISDKMIRGIGIGLIAGGLAGGAIGALGGAMAEAGSAALALAGAKKGALRGAGAGVYAGTAGSMVYIVVTGAVKLHKMNRDLPQISVHATNLIKTLFELFAEKQSRKEGNDPEATPYKFYCPISNEIYHIPVSTGCNAQRDENRKIMIGPDGKIIRNGESHTMEYSTLLSRMERSRKCPILGCGKEINKEEIFFEQELREKIKVIIDNTLSWLDESTSKPGDQGVNEEEILADSTGIIQRFKDGKSSAQDIYSLKWLIREEVNIYNRKVECLYRDLTRIINSHKYEDPNDMMDHSTVVLRLTQSYMIRLPKILHSKGIEDGKENEDK